MSNISLIALRRRLPYGVWTTESGTQILFDRRYDPIAEWSPGSDPKLINPATWIVYKYSFWFYYDGTAEADRMRVGLQVLNQWGIREAVINRAQTLPERKLSPYNRPAAA